MVSRSSSSNKSTSSSDTYDNKIAADGEATVIRNTGGSLTVNSTADIALPIIETLSSTLGNISTNVFDLADDAGDDAREIGLSALDFAKETAEREQATTQQALDTVGRGFAQALEEAREDDTQIASQLITYGVPAIALFLIWKML